MGLKSAEYRRLDATALADLIRRKEITPLEALNAALTEIERWQPGLNALVWQDAEKARDQAVRITSSLPFAGVPLLLKDTSPHDLAGAPTRDGSAVHRNRVASRNSYLVDKLLEAGFVTPGRTNVPEFCLKAITEPKAYGPTRNPWDRSRTPGGSSGGSAAAVAAGIVPVATASDGGGSIRIPAAYCGLFGLKPSRGRVSNGPDLAEVWNGLSCNHVLTRSVRDSAALLDVLSGACPGDPYDVTRINGSFARATEKPTGRLRIAVSTESPLGGPVHPDHERAVQDTAALLQDMGHEVEAAQPDVDGHQVMACYLMVYFGHMAAELAAIRSRHGAQAVNLVEPDTRVLGLQGETYSAGDYVRYHRLWNDFARNVGEFFTRYDLFLTPTTAQPPSRIGEQDSSLIEVAGSRLAANLGLGKLVRASGTVTKQAFAALSRVPFTQLSNFCGTPAMSVPMGRCEDGRLPCGVQFMAARGEDALLLQVAHQLEQAHPWPTLAPEQDASS
jgi:amidase